MPVNRGGQFPMSPGGSVGELLEGRRGGGLADALAWVAWTFPRLDLGHGSACDIGPAVTHDILSVSGDAPWPEGCGIFRLNS